MLKKGGQGAPLMVGWKMHEMSLVEALMDTLLDMQRRQGWSRVSRVTLKVGRLRQVVPEAMVFCFEVASKGTSVEGASLEIEEAPLVSRCTRCGEEWSDSESLGLCPFCGSVDVEVVQGMELLLESVEVELDSAEIGRN